MYFERIFDRGLAQASYLIGCQATGEALVVDPRRDVDVYSRIADREGLRISHVTETHIHADYLSGSRELAAATGAELLLSDMGGSEWRYSFEHEALGDRDHFMVGNIRVEAVHTPGHTPEHLTFIITDTPAGDAPTMALTGDFMFVGDVGRPDLLEKAAQQSGTQEAGARDLYHSLQKAAALPAYLPVWPGHGAGSACGKALGAVPSSSIGYEQATSWVYRSPNEDAFVRTILDGQPEPPTYFGRMKLQNREGPPLLGNLPAPGPLSSDEIEEAMGRGAQLVDARSKESFAAGYIPGSLNIQGDSGFSNWAGWSLDPDKPVVLLAPEREIEGLVRGLIRVGIDNIVGYASSLADWTSSGRSLAIVSQIEPKKLFKERDRYTVFDVRGADEWRDGHIDGARHIHVGHLRSHLAEIAEAERVVLHCASGARSTLGASILSSLGIGEVMNLTGGMDAWRAEGLPVSL